MRTRTGRGWLLVFVSLTWAAGATAQPAECQAWQECRDQTEAALAAGAAERAHDLAWRAVQRGPKDDPALMFLLARAQSASGRPEDALVMVRRLTERGVATEAASHPDLERMRARPGWDALKARMDELASAPRATVADMPRAAAPAAAAALPAADTPGAAAATPEVASSPAPRAVPAAPPVVAPTRVAPAGSAAAAAPRASAVVEGTAVVDERFRVAVEAFEASAVVYDAVSRRFLFGDRFGRKVRVVGEGLGSAVDLVRAESAGFFDVRALDIDRRRGDLWIASAARDGAEGKVHRIQLISGRPLMAFPGPTVESWLPVDLVVTEGGAVVVLDSTGRLWRVRPGGTAVEAVLDLDVPGAMSLAAGTSAEVAYVAHAGGLHRVDLAARTASPVAAPPEISLADLEHLRPHRGGLAGVWRNAEGQRRPVRFTLGNRGRAVTRAVVYPPLAVGAGDVLAMTMIEDDMVLVAPSVGGPPAEVRINYVRLQ